MSKAERNRRRRHERNHQAQSMFVGLSSWPTPPPEVLRGGTPEALALVGKFADAREMPCRATFLNDPVFGGALGGSAVDADCVATADEQGVTGIEALPVLLFEPRQLLGMQDTRTGTVHELRTEAMITAGFQRLNGPVWALSPAEGWNVGRTGDTIKLRDPDGDVMAESSLVLDPAWVSAAASYGYVMVLHGSPLGVRVPSGKTESTYTLADRAMEVRHARYNGLLVGALVTWAGTFTETFNWVLFPPGVFGIPVPVAYVPLWHFTPHGGPEEFGFARLNKRIEAPLADGLVANLTQSDLDLVRPDETDPGLALIAGYRDHDEPGDNGFFSQWQQTVLACGGLVVMTGNKAMPSVLGSDIEQDKLAWEAVSESWGARVILSEDSKADLLASPPARRPLDQRRDVIAQTEQQAEYTNILKDKLRGQKSFTVYASNDLEALIDRTGLAPWLTNLWPITCQTCGEPLGTKADLSADGPLEGGKVLISMHHSGCRPSGVTPSGGVRMTCPTHSVVAGYLSSRSGKPRKDDTPVMVINPSCEQLALVPDASGSWRNATLEGFTALGFVQPTGDFPPTITETEAEISDDYLIVTVTGYLPDMPDQEWAIKPPGHVLDQVRRFNGLAVSFVTKSLPTLLAPDDLPAAFSDDEARIGWVSLMPA